MVCFYDLFMSGVYYFFVGLVVLNEGREGGEVYSISVRRRYFGNEGIPGACKQTGSRYTRVSIFSWDVLAYPFLLLGSSVLSLSSSLFHPSLIWNRFLPYSTLFLRLRIFPKLLESSQSYPSLCLDFCSLSLQQDDLQSTFPSSYS